MSDQLHIEYEAEGLTREERLIISALQAGRENARAVPLLAALVGVDHRRLRAIVKHLIEEHGYCIGSTTRKPPGYYMIHDPQELADVYKKLRSRGLSILNRAAKIKKTSVKDVFGQGEL